MRKFIVWAMLGLLPLTATPGCAIFSENATADDRIADAEAILMVAKEVGPVLVARGTIKQEELDVALEFLQTALNLYEASLEEDDAVRRSALRSAVLEGIIRVVTLLSRPPA
jgi:hypothetical protein